MGYDSMSFEIFVFWLGKGVLLWLNLVVMRFGSLGSCLRFVLVIIVLSFIVMFVVSNCCMLVIVCVWVFGVCVMVLEMLGFELCSDMNVLVRLVLCRVWV